MKISSIPAVLQSYITSLLLRVWPQGAATTVTTYNLSTNNLTLKYITNTIFLTFLFFTYNFLHGTYIFLIPYFFKIFCQFSIYSYIFRQKISVFWYILILKIHFKHFSTALHSSKIPYLQSSAVICMYMYVHILIWIMNIIYIRKIFVYERL